MRRFSSIVNITPPAVPIHAVHWTKANRNIKSLISPRTWVILKSDILFFAVYPAQLLFCFLTLRKLISVTLCVYTLHLQYLIAYRHTQLSRIVLSSRKIACCTRRIRDLTLLRFITSPNLFLFILHPYFEREIRSYFFHLLSIKTGLFLFELN